MRGTFVGLVLTASLCAPPVLADRADDVASEYLATACADGKEHVGVYDPRSDMFVDLTVRSDAATATWDVARLTSYCTEPRLDAFHCHTTQDVFSAFPSGLDIALAARMEFDCAAHAATHGGTPPSIAHHIITTPGDGAVVEYGLTRPLTRIRALGHAQGIASRARERDAYWHTQDRDRADAIRKLQDTLHTRLAADLQGFMHEACPAATTTPDVASCTAITLERFLESRAQDAEYRIEVRRPAHTVTLSEALESAARGNEGFLVWRSRPRVFILASDLSEARASLGRISYFVEAEPGKIRALDEPVQNAAGYDLTSLDIARFFNTAQERDERLRPEEVRLRDALVSHGVLRRGGSGLEGSDRVLITFPVGHPNSQEVFLHEVSHALYFTDETYRRIADGYLDRALNDQDRQVFAHALRAFGYDESNAYLLRNETQAYLATDKAFTLVTTARNIAPTEELLLYIPSQNCEIPFAQCRLIALAQEYRARIASYFEGLLDP